MPAIVRGASAVQLTVISGSPQKHVISAAGVEPWMKKLTELTDGAVSYKYFPAGQLAPLRGLLDAISGGLADAAPIPVGYASDQMPLNGVTMLPGLGSSAGEVISAYGAVIKDEMFAQEYKKNNLVPIWSLAFPPYQYVATDEAVTTLDGFKGKVIRTAGGSTNLAIQALGGSPVDVAAGDIYVAMQRGTVNATISSYLTIEGYGIAELCKAASRNGSFGNFSNVMCINQSKWDSLPKDIQDAMLEAGVWTEGNITDVMKTSEETLAKKFMDIGMNVYNFPDDQLALINEKMKSVQQEWADRLTERGLPGDKALETYTAALGA
ncbi:TRAP transporter substrate-binding protein DctP [Acuticoccus sp. 2012]|uniref:TRAP transporter substrate-binding protein DctP n=2 Tax=Acuticoccus mangrovi TaxID=2796142 RepID=A0A934MGS5_9HYPH|nr:TRAP transporter substrate-binding protein DctP [Acuticoccus mangrovi]